MSDILFKNKFRIPSARLEGYDYAQNGWYFVTICTHEREHYFGSVLNGKMILNGMGEIVADEWRRTGIIRPYVILDEWIVMPNHVHLIINIKNDNKHDCPTYALNQTNIGRDARVGRLRHGHGCPNSDGYTENVGRLWHGRGGLDDVKCRENIGWPKNVGRAKNVPETPDPGVSTNVGSIGYVKNENNVCSCGGYRTEWKSGTVGEIINKFKRQCTVRIRQSTPYFHWQPRFYDEIIYEDAPLNKIRQYIIDNPENWERDRNNVGLWM